MLQSIEARTGAAIGERWAESTPEEIDRAVKAAAEAADGFAATSASERATLLRALADALESDRDAIEVALFSSLASERPRVCRIKNTARLDELWVSEALLEEVNQNSALRASPGVAPLEFDQKGNLL